MSTTKIHTFNTERQYTPAGQRIAWTIVNSHPAEDPIDLGWHLVSFADVDRHVDGVVFVLGDDEPTNDEVLKAYDRGDTAYDKDRERVAALYEQARKGEPT
jgi:hypothetical protein